MNDYSKKLLEYRAIRNLTQKQVAEELGCTRETVCKIESEKTMPSKLLKLKILMLGTQSRKER